MATLLDTNILLRLLQPNHPHSATAERSVNILRGRNEVLNIAPQNLVEFWAVATRPADGNGLGLSPEQAQAEIERLKGFFALLPEAPHHHVWERLALRYRASGKTTHDARLVAAMVVNSVENILTFNVGDFARYFEITTIDPVSVIERL